MNKHSLLVLLMLLALTANISSASYVRSYVKKSGKLVEGYFRRQRRSRKVVLPRPIPPRDPQSF